LALRSTEAIQSNAESTSLEAFFVNGIDEKFASAANGLHGGVVSLVGDPSPHSGFVLYLADLRLEEATSTLHLLDDIAPYFRFGTAAEAAADTVSYEGFARAGSTLSDAGQALELGSRQGSDHQRRPEFSW
jgi:hypothetical protein